LTATNIDAPPDSASARLRRKIDLAIGPFSAAFTKLVNHPRIAELWPAYLMTQHAIIRATVPLTQAALERALALPDDDSVASGLANYLEPHIDEELDHDAGLLDDLELLGIGRTEVLDRMPSPAVASLVGCQYYWIFHHHPVSFLGYIGVMEGYPPTPELIETLILRTGYPPAAFNTLVEHCELDPGHRDRLDRAIDALPLSRDQETAMGISAIATVGLAGRPIEEILERR
jgi:hypothetical protein